MRLSIEVFGYEFTFGPATPEPEPDFEPYQDAGATTSYPVGFTRPEVPWEDSGSLHQFEPDDVQ